MPANKEGHSYKSRQVRRELKKQKEHVAKERELLEEERSRAQLQMDMANHAAAGYNESIAAAKASEGIAKNRANEMLYKVAEWKQTASDAEARAQQMEFKNQDLSRELAGRHSQINQLEATKEMWKEQCRKEKQVGYLMSCVCVCIGHVWHV